MNVSPWLQLRAQIGRWASRGATMEVGEMAVLIDALVAELDELDQLADRWATRKGYFCGNARGVLMCLAPPEASESTDVATQKAASR